MAREKIIKKRTPKKRVKFGQGMLEVKEAYEKSLALSPEEIAKKEPYEPEHPPWGPFMSPKQHIFTSSYLDPNKAAGDVVLASRYAGIPVELGRSFLQMPQIKARINAAMGDVLAKPEMIVNTLIEMALDKETDDSARVRSLEMLAKIKGMMVDRSISAAIDLNDPNAGAKIDELIKHELARVTGKTAEEIINVEAEVITKDGGPVKPEMFDVKTVDKAEEDYPRCVVILNKKTGDKYRLHGAFKLLIGGAQCLKCGYQQGGDPENLRVKLQAKGYRLRDGAWYRPKVKGEG